MTCIPCDRPMSFNGKTFHCDNCGLVSASMVFADGRIVKMSEHHVTVEITIPRSVNRGVMECVELVFEELGIEDATDQQI